MTSDSTTDPQSAAGPLTIYTVEMAGAGYFGVEYFYQVLQAAVLLGSHEQRDVEVVFFPDALGRQSLLRAVRRFLRRIGGRSAATSRGESLFAALERSGRIVIRRPWGSVTIVRKRPRPLAWVRAVIGGLLAATHIWKRSRSRGRFDPAAFLRSTHRGAQVGDLVASTFHRSQFSNGELPPHPFLFYTLWKACELVNVAAAVSGGGDPRAQVAMTPELTYFWGAPLRYLAARGARIAWHEAPCAALAIHEAEGRGTPPRVWETPPTDPAPPEVIESYLQRRLFDPAGLMWYPEDFENNDNRAAALVDHRGNPVGLPGGGVVAVIFLHSFGDAQYYYGVDDFDTLEHWTYHSIERILANGEVAAVMIKPHPYSLYESFHADQRAFASIVERFEGNDRVTILHPRSSLVKLARISDVIGVTHHGSVAEEFVHLGRPVVASTFAGWGTTYRFVRSWSTVAEYDSILDRLAEESRRPPTAGEREELFRYISDRRLPELPAARRLPSLLLEGLSSPGGRRSGVDGVEDADGRVKRLSELAVGSRALEELLGRFESLPMSAGDRWIIPASPGALQMESVH